MGVDRYVALKHGKHTQGMRVPERTWKWNQNLLIFAKNKIQIELKCRQDLRAELASNGALRPPPHYHRKGEMGSFEYQTSSYCCWLISKGVTKLHHVPCGSVIIELSGDSSRKRYFNIEVKKNRGNSTKCPFLDFLCNNRRNHVSCRQLNLWSSSNVFRSS